MEQAGVQLIAQGADAYISDLKKASSATDSFVSGTEQGGGRVNAASQIMIGGLRQLGTIAIDAFAQAAKATAKFVGDSVNLAGDFEAGMLNFQAVAGKDVDAKGLEQFRDLFLQIGKELPVSTADVQKAATEMIKGGIDPAIVAAGGLKQNIQFAAAAMEGDLVAAAEISAKILGGWADMGATAAEKTDFLTMATNLMTKAANASAVDVKGLSQGIFNAQGIAKTAGVSFTDLTTTLAALAPRFASTSEAGNSLKNMIARLQPTTSPAASAMEGLGLYTEEAGSAFYDAQGNFVGFEAAAQLLQDSLKGLSKEQQALALQTIFGNDAMGSAAALADMGSAGYLQMAAAMAEANGVSENAALKQQGYNTALDNAKGSVEALQITIGSVFLPMLADLLNNYISPAVNSVTEFAGAFAKMIPAIQASDDPIQTFLNALKVAAPEFLDVISGVEDFKDTIASIVGPIIDAASALGDRLEPIVVSASETIQTLITSFSDGGDSANVLGGVLEDLSGIWTEAGKVVDNVMAAYQRIAQAVLPVVTQFVDDHGTEISAFFKQTWDQVVTIVMLALKLYDSIVPPILNAVAGLIEEHGEEIQKVLTGAWAIITSLITGTLETITGIIKVALDLINGDWDAAWTDIQGVISAQATAIEGVIGGFLDMIAGIFNTSMDDILATWRNNWNQALEIVSKIDWSEAGAQAVAGIQAGVSAAWGDFINWLVDKAGDALDAVFEAWGVSSPATEWMPAGSYAIQGIMVGMEGMIPELLTLVNTTGTGMINALTKNISAGGDAIRKQMADLEADIKEIGVQINDAIADSFGATASIDRQMAANIDKLGDVLPEYQQFTQGALKQVQQEALKFADPTEGAKYFKMRSAQIMEFADLQKQLSEAEEQDDRDRIIARMNLINKAQDAEISQFQTQQRGKTTPQEEIAAEMAALFQSNDVARNLPGVLQNAIIAQFTSMMQQLQQVQPPGYAAPPAYPAQQSSWQAPPATSSSTRTYNMPIYTNNTPAALQQSMAIAQAVMP